MTGDKIIIQPEDLQQIIKELAAKKWSAGPVIIREVADTFIIRDKDEQYITLVKNHINKDG